MAIVAFSNGWNDVFKIQTGILHALKRQGRWDLLKNLQTYHCQHQRSVLQLPNLPPNRGSVARGALSWTLSATAFPFEQRPGIFKAIVFTSLRMLASEKTSWDNLKLLLNANSSHSNRLATHGAWSYSSAGMRSANEGSVKLTPSQMQLATDNCTTSWDNCRRRWDILESFDGCFSPWTKSQRSPQQLSFQIGWSSPPKRTVNFKTNVRNRRNPKSANANSIEKAPCYWHFLTTLNWNQTEATAAEGKASSTFLKAAFSWEGNLKTFKAMSFQIHPNLPLPKLENIYKLNRTKGAYMHDLWKI